MALVVDLAVPDLPTGRVTVVSVHLENKCPPGCRQRQMKALLMSFSRSIIQSILAGDLNTSGQDGTPTSVRNEIMKRVTDYRFWVNQGIFWFSPVSIPQYAIVHSRATFTTTLTQRLCTFRFYGKTVNAASFKRSRNSGSPTGTHLTSEGAPGERSTINNGH